MAERRLSFPFRISIALAFALITVPLLLVVIGTLYLRNVNLAREFATELIDRASADISAHVEGLLTPLVRVVDATTALARIDPDKLRNPETFQYLLTVLQSTPHAEMLYVGYEKDGAFYQVRRLHPDLKRSGTSEEKPQQNAAFALRTIDTRSGEMADINTYIAGWGEIVTTERSPVRYDPRTRPWYIATRDHPGVSISDAYVFFSTGQPGLTLSRQIATAAGTPIGAVGIDISLGALSDFMARRQLGESGIAFIVDNNGNLIGYPKLDKIVRQDGDKLTITKAIEIDDPRIVQAVTLRQQGSGNRFKAELANGTNFVSFTQLPERFGKDWTIGVIAAEYDFVAPIRNESLIMLSVGGGALALSVLAILYVSGSLTRPLKRIVNETKRIRQFELGGGIGVESRIVEINEVSHALEAMEAGLRSFGAYIPKALVRSIVSSGKDEGIGGEKRVLTILFTDIQDFTRRAEALSPEQIFDQLSSHFTALSRAIFDRGGTIDKFIGDSVMAFWNAPLPDPRHAANACYAVLRCKAVNEALNTEFAERGYEPMRTRFGLHTGEAVVGNVGSTDRMQYTALGAQVNMASRIEGLNKYYGTTLLVSGSVEEEVRELFLFRPIDRVVPAGTSQAIELFELLGASGSGPDAATETAVVLCENWNRALEAYRQRDWRRALRLFSDFARAYPDDSAVLLYTARCMAFLDTPPAANWDGAEHFATK